MVHNYLEKNCLLRDKFLTMDHQFALSLRCLLIMLQMNEIVQTSSVREGFELAIWFERGRISTINV